MSQEVCKHAGEGGKFCSQCGLAVTLLDRIEAKYIPEPMSGCWLWIGALDPGRRGGYGMISVKGKIQRAHRVVYELLCGPIPEGLELDHRCHVRSCVNPWHLRPVTHQENVRSALPRSRPTLCARGHSDWVLSTGSGGLERRCRTCRHHSRREWRRQAASGPHPIED